MNLRHNLVPHTDARHEAGARRWAPRSVEKPTGRKLLEEPDILKWKNQIAYRCALDPRVIVPRRRRWMGWTIDFANERKIAVDAKVPYEFHD